jgi:phosphatidylinositol phospholipase C delta
VCSIWQHLVYPGSYQLPDIKEEFTKARHNVIGRIKGHGKTPSAISQALVGPPTATAVAMVKSPDKRTDKPKVKMSMNVVALLVYTVGVKCRGINKKEHYAPEHVFSLSENTANKILKQGMHDLIKHTRTHVVRIYPKGLRFGSTNYEPHRYWSAGAQLVAINWQTFGGYLILNIPEQNTYYFLDMGYMINHSMFQRNGRSGYVLKPLALRSPDKDLLSKRTKHILDIKVSTPILSAL